MNRKLTHQGVHSGREWKLIWRKCFHRLAHTTWSRVLAYVMESLTSGDSTLTFPGVFGSQKECSHGWYKWAAELSNKPPGLPGGSKQKVRKGSESGHLHAHRHEQFILLSKACLQTWWEGRGHHIVQAGSGGSKNGQLCPLSQTSSKSRQVAFTSPDSWLLWPLQTLTWAGKWPVQD